MTRSELALGGAGVAGAIASTIRSARQLAGWTQRELAGRSGTSQATVSRLETGAGTSLDLANAERLLAALGLRPKLVLDDRALR